MTQQRLWHAHGLVIGCDDIDLDLRPHLGATADRRPDVSFRRLPDARIPQYGDPLPGRVLAQWDDGAGSALTVAEQPTTADRNRSVVMICFHGLAVASIDRTTWETSLTMAADADPELARVLIAGTVISIVLMLRGHPVLHASGAVVSLEDQSAAIAFVGHSGMGKSTMAALLCRDGATLLTDDVLRTDISDTGSVVAWPGSSALRLRAKARQLGVDAAGEVTTTADGRFSAAPPTAENRSVRLAALVVPQPDPTCNEVEATPLVGVDAVLTLAGFPRIHGWTDPATLGQALGHWGALARRVPVMTLRVPWGLFDEGVGAVVVERIAACARLHRAT